MIYGVQMVIQRYQICLSEVKGSTQHIDHCYHYTTFVAQFLTMILNAYLNWPLKFIRFISKLRQGFQDTQSEPHSFKRFKEAASHQTEKEAMKLLHYTCSHSW